MAKKLSFGLPTVIMLVVFVTMPLWLPLILAKTQIDGPMTWETGRRVSGYDLPDSARYIYFASSVSRVLPKGEFLLRFNAPISECRSFANHLGLSNEILVRGGNLPNYVITRFMKQNQWFDICSITNGVVLSCGRLKTCWIDFDHETFYYQQTN